MTSAELPTALDAVRGVDLTGRVAVVTGATSGLGIETARALASAGATVVLGVRNTGAGSAIAERIAAEWNCPAPLVLPLELSDLASVRAFAADLSERFPAIHLLVANAGVSKTPEAHLANGLDVRFATNHLGHFALARGLLPQLSAEGARIVLVSSAAHKGRPFNFADPQWQAREHNVFAAYGESKTANILFAGEASRRWGDRGVAAFAVLPGSIRTGLQRFHGDEMLRTIGFVQADGSPNPALRSPEQGAATSVWACVAPDLAGRGGLVLENCGEAVPVGPGTHPWSGFDPSVASEADARRLWQLSEELLTTL